MSVKKIIKRTSRKQVKHLKLTTKVVKSKKIYTRKKKIDAED
jgi:hypothetical protein